MYLRKKGTKIQDVSNGLTLKIQTIEQTLSFKLPYTSIVRILQTLSVKVRNIYLVLEISSRKDKYVMSLNAELLDILSRQYH
jgi:hypothetical protein